MVHILDHLYYGITLITISYIIFIHLTLGIITSLRDETFFLNKSIVCLTYTQLINRYIFITTL